MVDQTGEATCSDGITGNETCGSTGGGSDDGSKDGSTLPRKESVDYTRKILHMYNSLGRVAMHVDTNTHIRY